jgi:hypothetical protein
VVAAAAEVAADAAAAEVAAGAVASVVAAVAGVLAAEVAGAAAVVAAAAGSVASGSVAAWAVRLAGVAAHPGEGAACAKSDEKRRCDGRRITSGLPQQSDKLGVGRHFAKVHKSSLLTASIYRLRSITH